MFGQKRQLYNSRHAKGFAVERKVFALVQNRRPKHPVKVYVWAGIG